MQVPVGVAVTNQLRERFGLAEHGIDDLDSLIAFGCQEPPQIGAQRPHLCQLGPITRHDPGVAELVEYCRQLFNLDQRVGGLRRVDQGHGSKQRTLGVMPKDHVDTLHVAGLVSHVMAAVTHDNTNRDSAASQPSRIASGIGLALASAMSFSLSGPIAKGLLGAGWTPGAAVTVRVLIAAAILLVPGLLALRGRWGLLRQNARLLAVFGLLAVAGCQLAYFNAVDRMQVGVALLIEYTCPIAVLVWMWFRHSQRPTRLTVIGAAIALAGLVLVLDLLSGTSLDGIGVVWALTSMLCAAVYWVVAADESTGLPGIVLAAGGLLIGGLTLLAAGLVGIIPFAASTDDVVLAETAFPWWLALLALGAITAALGYVLGIAATRRLGSRLASFVGLSEVVSGVLFAWLLLSETPRLIQLAGGALILVGVIAVRLGEPRPIAEAPLPPPT